MKRGKRSGAGTGGVAEIFFNAIGRFVSMAVIAAALVECTREPAPDESANPGSDDTTSAAILELANRDAASFLDRIPVGFESDYGFDARSEFGRVRAAAPLRVHTIDVDSSGSTSVISKAIRPLDEWRVPLTVDGERRALITVVMTKEGLEIVDLGASGLARALNSLDTRIPSGTRESRFILRIIELRRDFLGVSVPSEGDRFYPVGAAISKASGLSNTALPAVSGEAPVRFFDRAGIVELLKTRVETGAR